MTCLAAAVGLLVVAMAAVPAAAEELAFEADGWVEAPAPAAGTPAAELAEVRMLLRNEEFGEAFRAARALVREHPTDPLVDEALFLAGEAQLRRERYWSAYEWFEKLVERVPAGGLYERALRREAVIGEAFLAGEKRPLWGFIPLPATDEGIEILQRVADRLPGSQLASRSLMRIGDFQFARQRWVEAAATYQEYIERFRGRYRSDEALLKAAQATYAQFGDVYHDETSLIEAEQLFSQYVAQYPDRPGAEQAAAALRTIRSLRAEKAYRTGRFYERIGRPVSAGVYYRDVVARYGDTPWAARSAEALGDLDLPTSPEPQP